MIVSIPIALGALFFLTTLTTAQLVLSNLQNITGFSSQCTSAYDTPIPQCDPAHFANGALCSCSSDCEAALGQITGTLISACQGTGASDNTLLGLFFSNEGVSFLCDGGTGGGCGSAASSGASSAPSSTSASSESAASSSSSTSVIASTITTTTSPSSTSRHSSIASSLVASTSKARTTSTSHSSSSSTTTAATSSRSISPLAQSGGGGSPFDISSDAARNCRAGGFLVVGTVLLALLLA